MRPDELFFDTLEHLRQCIGLRASEYDTVQASGLIRRLLIDKNKIGLTAAKRAGMEVRFAWSRARVYSPAEAWIPGLWLDPQLAEELVEQVFPDQADDVHAIGYFEGGAAGFLGYAPIVKDGETITVAQLVKHFANREGGVPYDPRRPVSPLLKKALSESPDMVLSTLIAIGRIVHKGFEPVGARLVLGARPFPRGFLRLDRTDM